VMSIPRWRASVSVRTTVLSRHYYEADPFGAMAGGPDCLRMRDWGSAPSAAPGGHFVDEDSCTQRLADYDGLTRPRSIKLYVDVGAVDSAVPTSATPATVRPPAQLG